MRELASSGFTVIVKLHDRSATRSTRWRLSPSNPWAGRYRGTAIAREIPTGRGHLATEHDSSPYLAAADVLVTDHSSLSFEYLLLDRPVVRIDLPELIDKTRTRRDYVELLASASTSVTDASEVPEAVRAQLADPERQSPERRAAARRMFHKPGTATPRAVSALYELLGS